MSHPVFLIKTLLSYGQPEHCEPLGSALRPERFGRSCFVQEYLKNPWYGFVSRE